MTKLRRTFGYLKANLTLGLALCMLLVVFGLWALPTQQPVIAAADPATTAIEISQLEAQGRFSDIYDQMHPDAQAFIPRAAVVGWYENDFAPLGPGVITVTGVEYVTWTWPVTGKTYANTAEVSFQQPFANGVVVSEVVRLVKSGGNWRWFFGRSSEFVSEQTAKYGQGGEPAPVDNLAIQSSDDTCASMLVPAMQQVGLDPDILAPTLGCEASGSLWRMRTVGETQSSDILDGHGRTLQRSIDVMAMDDVFAYVVRFDRSTSTVYTIGSGNKVSESDFANQGIGAGPTWLHNYDDLYSEAMEIYLLNNGASNPELIEYLQWFTSRRDATLQAMSGGMDPMAGGAFLSNWGYQQWPWFWQLSDPVAIAAYMGSGSLNGGRNDTLLPTPTQSSIPADDSATSEEVNIGAVFSPTQLTIDPGESADITVLLPPTSFGGGFFLNVILPAGIELTNLPTCKPSLACESGALQTEITQSQGGSTVVNVSGLLMDTNEPAKFSMTLALSEAVPTTSSLLVTADLGFTSHSAPVNGPIQSSLEIFVGGAGTESPVTSEGLVAPTDVDASLPNTRLTFSPGKVQARAGETIVLDLSFPRLQGIDSVAFMASSEAMVITNLPRYLIDDVGNAACSAGHDGDIVPPEERATDLTINADFPQTQLEVVISPDVGPGDQLIVCV